MALYFFGPKKSRRAELDGGVQVIKVTVKGGYTPDVIQVTPGVPVRLLFDRQESGDCSSRVVFPDFKVNQTLPAFETTAVEFLPEVAGEYEFACGMSMLHGRLRVVGDAASADAGGGGTALALAAPPATATDQHGCCGDVATDATPVAVAPVTDGVQVVDITVKGGYSPGAVRVLPGLPVRLVLDRQEDSSCSERLLLPDLNLDVALPAFERTTIELPALTEGAHTFTCGMGMLRGNLLVGESACVPEADDDEHVTATAVISGGSDPLGAAAAAESAESEERERNAEISDLKRRVIFGAILTAPVLFAVMFVEFFGVTWMPDLLMNRFFQLALITPVMFYTGWPIHRTGWLALSHRTADMNSLITLGTIAAYGYSLVVTLLPDVLPANVQEVYYEAVGVIVTLILLGRLFETKAKAGTGEAIRTLIGLQPRTARVIRDGAESEIDIDEVALGDIVVVRPGEKLPVDGEVVAPRWTSPWSPVSRSR